MEETRIDLNRLGCLLRDICKSHILEEKWLVAPSRRVGFQWLDVVARSGVPVLNVRVKTMRHLALEIACPEMNRLGVAFLRGVQAEVLIDRIFRRVKEANRGYISSMEPSTRLMRAVHNSVQDLRLAGLSSKDLPGSAFEVEAKGDDIKTVLAEYEQELQRSKLLDYADILRISIRRLRADRSLLKDGILVLLPEDLEGDLHCLERGFWESFPEQSRRPLGVDQPDEIPQGGLTDAALLRWIARPLEAPAAKGDGTARMFRAVGEVNEVREVFRRCVEEKIPFDEVEIIHTDALTYVPLVYEAAWCLKPEDDEQVPVTFAEGIPPRYSRPARALMGWLEWIRDGYPQTTLVRMIQEGLLEIEQKAKLGFSFIRLGAALRAVHIGNGRERYLRALDAKLRALEVKAKDGQPNGKYRDEEADEPPTRNRADTGQRIEGLRAIRGLVSEILSFTPEPGQGQKEFLEGATCLLDRQARCVNQFDQYTREQLLKEVQELTDCIEDEDLRGLDVLGWLGDLCQTSHVAGLGPRPGCVYVAPIHSGGHSGRRRTFIVGLDDSRFPGAGLQDPLLLDAERAKISADLPTAGSRLARDIEDFARLLSRLRGNVTLSYCSRSLQDDRDMFPSPVVLSAYRILSGEKRGDQNALLKWLRDPASFAPNSPDRCVDPTEWWLWRMCAAEEVEEPEEVIAENFPHLGRGLTARKARESDQFTAYDGYVPEAGKDFDPTQEGGPVVSASQMEKLGSCPMEYFFKYVLRIEPPEEYKIDPKVWLDPAQKGQLLHAVFRESMCRLRDKGLLPAFDRDWNLMLEVLSAQVEAWRTQHPPPSLEVFDREVRDLRQIARIFLLEEERFCRTSKPFCFEAALGLSQDGTGTVLDTPEPVEIPIGAKRVLRVRGRIDRVDEVPGTKGRRFAVWDYKTGSAWRQKRGRKGNRSKDREDPFDQGRLIQGSLYLALAEACLKQKVSRDACVDLFGYFFPSTREHGERIQWSSSELAHGKDVLARLCEMIAKGCFPFTDDLQDVKFSDYLDAFGDVAAASEAITRKLENSKNANLAPFQELRGYVQKSEK